MKLKGNVLRLKPKFVEFVKIPKKFKPYFWDCPDNKTYLEKFIIRILTYGRFDEIKWVYKKYPQETYDVIMRYNEIKRGVKFWIKLWKERELKK